MEAEEVIQEQNMPVGGFLSWLLRTRRALITEAAVDVPCGECRACCTSSYFIHIGPDETETLARIPKELLFPAPRLPKGNVLLGYDKKGHCPLFINNTCSIYDQRPRTCATYDCRIFPATGLSAGDDRALICQQARRWKFDFPTTEDHRAFSAVRAAAAFLRERAVCFPAGFVPSNTTQQAVIAIEVYEVFLSVAQESLNSESADIEGGIAEAIIVAYKRFETREESLG